MLRTTITGLLIFAFVSLSLADDTDQSKLDFSKAWFKPYLTSNKDRICDLVLNDAQDFFLTDKRWSGYREPAHDSYVKSLVEVSVEDGRGVIHIKGMPLYFYQHTDWSNCCMGTQSLMFSDKAFPDDYSWSYEAGYFAPMENGFFRIYSDTKDNYIVATDLNGTTSNVYLINPDHSTALMCSLKLEPDQSEIDAAAVLIDAKKEVDNLESSLALVRGGSGNCGSARSHGWGSHWTSQRLKSTLFRPWAIDLMRSSADTDVQKNIYLWSLLGISNYESVTRLNLQRGITIGALKNLYINEYGIQEDAAGKMADSIIDYVIAESMSFSSNFSDVISEEEKTLREMILKNENLSDIKNYSSSIDLNFDQFRKYKRNENESLLNVSIYRPDVIKILLKNKIYVDTKNAFGKTPLMYAAQYNQIDSAKALIDHEANTVAATTRPVDTCYYTLQTFGMTPLHYAVRYASPDFIKLLLDNGAVPFMKAENHRKYPMVEETPLDWLHRYTAADSPEKNPNIPDDKIAEVEKWLQPLGAEELSAKVQDYIVAAEKAYQKGKTQEAYRHLIKAIEIQPDNERALSDMSLVALKNGDFGASLAAGEKLIKNSDNNKFKANAWFNQGLACEKFKESRERGSLSYNGQYYCQQSIFYPYLQSWINEKNSSRSNKLQELFKNDVIDSCKIIPSNDEAYKLHFSNADKKQKIYVYHLKKHNMDATQIHWDIKFWDAKTGSSQEPTRFVPSLVATHDLGDYVIDELESVQGVKFPVHVGDLKCDSMSSKDYGSAASHPELHVIAVHEPKNHSEICPAWHSKCGDLSIEECHKKFANVQCEEFGNIDVMINKIDNPIILSLSSYDTANWVIHNEHNVKIDKVILSGYYEQKITGLDPDTRIEKYFKDNSMCNNCFDGKSYFFDYKKPEKHLKTMLGYKPESFQGRYSESKFSIPFHGPELHVVGVYEGTDPLDDGTSWHQNCDELDSLQCHQRMTDRQREIWKEVLIKVEENKNPIILALTANDKTRWVISNQHNVKIEKVILGGYHAQTVSGLEQSIPVEVYTYDASDGCVNCTKGKGYFYSHDAAPRQLKALTGIEPTTFQGKYKGESFSIYPAVYIADIEEVKTQRPVNKAPKPTFEKNNQDLIINHSSGGSVRIAGAANAFLCDDPNYKDVKKKVTMTIQGLGPTKELCEKDETD